jgi:hypothetical protein
MQVAYTPTCCVLIRREIFEIVGMMDERYFVYFDDTDFMLRCLKTRLKLFLLPSATLQHKVSSLSGHQANFPNRYVYRNLAYFTCKHFGRFRASVYSLMYQTAFLVKLITGQDTKAAYLLKRSAFKEGLRMASAASSIQNH